MKNSLFISFLYKTVPGRMILKILVQPKISAISGKILKSRISKLFIPIFIKKYRIDIQGFEETRYRSLNDFFIRKRLSEGIDITPGHLISPCDGYLSIYPISECRTFTVKHTRYTIDTLLRSKKIARYFEGGTCMVFRLTPGDYHRFCHVSSGRKKWSRVIGGVLHCIRPVENDYFPVYIENSREYTVIDTGLYGYVLQMELGALLVGRIHNHCTGCDVLQGIEKGYFEFGGSTIIVLSQKNRLEVSEDIFNKSRYGQEIRVTMGQMIGIMS